MQFSWDALKNTGITLSTVLWMTYRHLDGRFENFCNSVETILRTRGPVLLHREVK